MREYRRAEDRLMRVIASKYGFEWPLREAVHEADLRLLATERRDLMPFPPRPRLSTERVEPLAWEIRPWTWDVAKCVFLEEFHELTSQGVNREK